VANGGEDTPEAPQKDALGGGWGGKPAKIGEGEDFATKTFKNSRERNQGESGE